MLLFIIMHPCLCGCETFGLLPAIFPSKSLYVICYAKPVWGESFQFPVSERKINGSIVGEKMSDRVPRFYSNTSLFSRKLVSGWLWKPAIGDLLC